MGHGSADSFAGGGDGIGSPVEGAGEFAGRGSGKFSATGRDAGCGCGRDRLCVCSGGPTGVPPLFVPFPGREPYGGDGRDRNGQDDIGATVAGVRQTAGGSYPAEDGKGDGGGVGAYAV